MLKRFKVVTASTKCAQVYKADGRSRRTPTTPVTPVGFVGLVTISAGVETIECGHGANKAV